MVVLHDENEDVIGDVEGNNEFDFWNGRNYQNGGTGRHLGFGQLEDGRFYLIYGTQWQGEQDIARIVSAQQIVKEAIKSDNTMALEEYPELLEIYQNEFNKREINEKSKVFSLRINLNENEGKTNDKIEEFIQKVKDYKNLE